jgi:hypothetical protein
MSFVLYSQIQKALSISQSMIFLFQDIKRSFFYSFFLQNVKEDTVFFNMLANVGRVRVSENINEKRENLCSFMLFDKLL